MICLELFPLLGCRYSSEYRLISNVLKFSFSSTLARPDWV